MPLTGETPPDKHLPNVTISGFLPCSFKSHSLHMSFPVLPRPVWTSSTIRRQLCFSVSCFIFQRYSSCGTITPPSPYMASTITATVFGFWMMIELNLWSSVWMNVKLGLTLLLWAYHLYTHALYKRLQNDSITWSSKHYRLWNELATLWLVSIVFVVVLKNTMDWIYGTIGFFGVGVLLMLGIRLYRRMNK